MLLLKVKILERGFLSVYKFMCFFINETLSISIKFEAFHSFQSGERKLCSKPSVRACVRCVF